MAIALAFPSTTTSFSFHRPPTTSSTSSSSSLLTATTPPTTPTKYIRSGIGGAGNWHKASTLPPSTPRSPPPPPPLPQTASTPSPTRFPPNLDTSPAPLLSTNKSNCYQHHHHRPPPSHIKSGIGGLGNIHAVTPATLLAHTAAEALQTRRRAALVEAHAPTSFHVGIGGAGNFRSCSPSAAAAGTGAGTGTGGRTVPLRGQRSMGVLGGGTMRRFDGGGRVEVGGVERGLPRGRERSIAWGEESVEEYEEEEEEDGEGEECVYYSNEPLPYGALDILRRRLERAFSRSGGREVLAMPGEKGRAVLMDDEDGGQERRFLRSHRSMWRF